MSRQSMRMTTTQQPRVSGIEVRSIDYVPLSERHGKVWHLGPLWFMSNAQIATLAVGLISITSGGSLLWSVVAIVLGTLIGTLFMAFHSAQGPQLGLPQMIQSRPQFGYIGALLVWLFAYVQYAGFNVFNTILGGDAMSRTAHGPPKMWFVIVTAAALVIAVIGYDLIHKAERWLTYAMLLIFGILTITLFFIHYPAGTFAAGSFKATPFLAQFGVVAGYQVSWAIYVSDYSRYLPPNVPVRKTFFWTFWGSAIGGAWMMVVGTFLAAWAGSSFSGNGIAELDKVGDHVFTGFGAIVLILAAIGLVSVTALNMYGGSLTLISAVDSFKRVRPTLSLRLITVGLTAVLSLIGALAATAHFLTYFNDFLLLVLYLFIPWTAVNLVDYYIVRRGHYAVAEIFNPNGMYGRWGWRGVTAYLIAFACMSPFFAVGSAYVGIAARALNGADISFFVGLPIAAVLYYVFSRSIDVAAETRVAEAEAAELERAAGSLAGRLTLAGLRWPAYGDRLTLSRLTLPEHGEQPGGSDHCRTEGDRRAGPAVQHDARCRVDRDPSRADSRQRQAHDAEHQDVFIAFLEHEETVRPVRQQPGDEHHRDHRRAGQRRQQPQDQQRPCADLSDHAQPRLQHRLPQAQSSEPAGGPVDFAAAAPVVDAVRDHRDPNDYPHQQQHRDLRASHPSLLWLVSDGGR